MISDECASERVEYSPLFYWDCPTFYIILLHNDELGKKNCSEMKTTYVMDVVALNTNSFENAVYKEIE